MKKLFGVFICFAMILALLPVTVFATGEQETVIAEATSTFATEQEAFDGDLVTFRAISDGAVTIQIVDCSPGYYIEVYEGANWVEDYYDALAGLVTLNVTSGVSYELVISSYDMEEGAQVPGFITYKITSSVVTTDEESTEDEDPSVESGGAENSLLQINENHSMYIEAGQTIWFAYTDNASAEAAKVLHINGRTTYSVRYNGNDVPVDEDGYVNYLMEDGDEQGTHVFSVTNDGANKVYFTISITDRPAYVNTGAVLELGENVLTLNADAANSLYGFTPEQTGEYLFTVSEGVIGNWGTSFNPVDNTADKGSTLSWTCTSVGQSILVGVTGAASTVLNVKRTGDYIPPVEIPWEFYEYSYDFSYEIPFDAVIIDIDVTDSDEDVAVLGEDGFYRYGSADGPLMVADLSNVEINILDAYNYGQLRAYLYDEEGVQIARIDYNDAMYEYATYGLAPVTEELATMIKHVGDTQSWWVPGGFVFQDSAPLNEESAWMAFCSYVEGSELVGENVGSDNGGKDTTDGNDQNNGSGETSGDGNQGNDNVVDENDGTNNSGSDNGMIGGSNPGNDNTNPGGNTDNDGSVNGDIIGGANDSLNNGSGSGSNNSSNNGTNDGSINSTNNGSNGNSGSGSNNGFSDTIGGNTVTGSDSHSKPSGGNGGGSPGTYDLSVFNPVCILILATLGLVFIVSLRRKFV